MPQPTDRGASYHRSGAPPAPTAERVISAVSVYRCFATTGTLGYLCGCSKQGGVYPFAGVVFPVGSCSSFLSGDPVSSSAVERERCVGARPQPYVVYKCQSLRLDTRVASYPLKGRVGDDDVLHVAGGVAQVVTN